MQTACTVWHGSHPLPHPNPVFCFSCGTGGGGSASSPVPSFLDAQTRHVAADQRIKRARRRSTADDKQPFDFFSDKCHTGRLCLFGVWPEIDQSRLARRWTQNRPPVVGEFDRGVPPGEQAHVLFLGACIGTKHVGNEWWRTFSLVILWSKGSREERMLLTAGLSEWCAGALRFK